MINSIHSTVIEDTLKVSYFGPASHSISEGESLQLKCQVSTETFQHTHLSVTWYLRGSTDTRPIISLDQDLTVKPGPEFKDRYASGLIALEKVEDNIYILKISQVQQSDSGEIYCQADEWIQDPDRSWVRICHRNTTGSNVEVKALGKIYELDTYTVLLLCLLRPFQNGTSKNGILHLSFSVFSVCQAQPMSQLSPLLHKFSF